MGSKVAWGPVKGEHCTAGAERARAWVSVAVPVAVAAACSPPPPPPPGAYLHGDVGGLHRHTVQVFVAAAARAAQQGDA